MLASLRVVAIPIEDREKRSKFHRHWHSSPETENHETAAPSLLLATFRARRGGTAIGSVMSDAIGLSALASPSHRHTSFLHASCSPIIAARLRTVKYAVSVRGYTKDQADMACMDLTVQWSVRPSFGLWGAGEHQTFDK
ncbi:hypothetical protein C8R45DRAFT_948423 [Mycena sanguinolenta]|nr:hypothetical protein C8R45DRAFT_948423 [Mycena sanguinolenta]